jgi:hypothetical protein
MCDGEERKAQQQENLPPYIVYELGVISNLILIATHDASDDNS